jgi:segregation and condensation protein A
VTVAERLTHLRALLSRGRFTFSDAVGRADRVTVAVTLYALLELYKQGEATWTQDEPFAEITVEALTVPNRLPSLADRRAAGGGAAAGEQRLTA